MNTIHPCAGCRHLNGPWCKQNPRGYAYAHDERRYGPVRAFLFGHCGKSGRHFEPVEVEGV